MAVRCVDASFVVAWLLPDTRTPAVMEAWQAFEEGRDDFVAPPLLYPETISAIRQVVHRGNLTLDEGQAIVDDFLALAIPTPVPTRLYQHAYILATRFRQPKAYDATYLALANILSCELLTLDARLFNAVADDFPFIRLVRV